MDNRSPRTIEETLGIIADALVSLTETQGKILALTEESCKSSTRRCACSSDTHTAPAPSAVSAVERPAHSWTYEELKAELLKRGVEIAKGTKMTTLLKFWEMHKNDPELRVAEEAPAAEETPVAEETEKLPPVPEDVAIDEPIDAEELTKEPAKPMTMEEARKHIMNSGYTATPNQTAAMKAALDKAGVARFALIAEGGFEDFINSYFAELAKLEAAL